MQLKEIYHSIQEELSSVDKVITTSLSATKHKSILNINRFLLESPGKRLRPALVILCAKATKNHHSAPTVNQLTKIASAIELIHMASLIHDDVVDHSLLRHNKPTVNYKWGNDVSIASGDYLYSLAFELISTCGNTDILGCISSATKSMCEGELIQVCERDNLDLLKQRYLFIVKKKTAALFAACCRCGAMLVERDQDIQDALKGYGLNFGIAFQIVDDCLDLIGKEKDLGKSPGTDFKMGEITLPVLHILSESKDKGRLLSLVRQRKKGVLIDLKERFINSKARLKTKDDISSYIQRAKRSLSCLGDSCFKEGLFSLADYIAGKI